MKNVVDEHAQKTILKFELLSIIEFTSARKRMTSSIRMDDGSVKVLIKGADSIIIPRLKD